MTKTLNSSTSKGKGKLRYGRFQKPLKAGLLQGPVVQKPIPQKSIKLGSNFQTRLQASYVDIFAKLNQQVVEQLQQV